VGICRYIESKSPPKLIVSMNDALNYYQNYRSEMQPLLPENYSRVLEIGCGEGYFRNNLSLDHEYWGVEPTPEIAQRAKERLDKVLIGTYDEVANHIPSAYFDLVICNDVIEHMTDHDQFLQAIKSKMKPGGSLVASIPNVRHILNLFEVLVKKDWQYKNAGILDRTHFRFFTKKSLQRIIVDNGYESQQFIGINAYRADSFIKGLFAYFVILALGQDTRFLQFGIRIRVVE